MNIGEARADLMLAQADISYRPKDDSIDMAIKALENQKTGHWILTDVEGNRVWNCNCSECGKDPQDYIGGSENWWLIKNKLPKYCPNCGAKMEGENNDENKTNN